MATPIAPTLTPLARALVLLREPPDATIEVLELDLDTLDPEQAAEIEDVRDYLRTAYHPVELALSCSHGICETVADWHRVEVVALAVEDLDDDTLAVEVRRLQREGKRVPKPLARDRAQAYLDGVIAAH